MLVYTRTTRIEWGDCDPAGIVFYPRYFAMFDSCTTALFSQALGMSKYQFTRQTWASVGGSGRRSGVTPIALGTSTRPPYCSNSRTAALSCDAAARNMGVAPVVMISSAKRPELPPRPGRCMFN